MRILTLFILFLGLHGFAQKTPEQSVKDFFKAFHQQDTVALKQMTQEDIVLKTIGEGRDGNFMIKTSPRAQFVSSIGSIPKEMKFEERILSYETKIDKGFASVWTTYEFYLNGKFSHCGINQIQLFKSSEEEWSIISITDTRRTENCD